MHLKQPYLVQRILKRDTPKLSGKGVDAYFSFDYMGSSEFEWGALPAALKLMRASKAEMRSEPLRHAWASDALKREAELWYVGLDREFDVATSLVLDQMQPRDRQKWHLKEYTFLRAAMGAAEPGWSPGDCKVIGWWAIDATVPWCLFKSKADAVLWINAL